MMAQPNPVRATTPTSVSADRQGRGTPAASPPKLLWIGPESALRPSVERAFEVKHVPRLHPARAGEDARGQPADQAHCVGEGGASPDLVLVNAPSQELDFRGCEALPSPSVVYLLDSHFAFPWQIELARLFDFIILDVWSARPYFESLPADRFAWCPFFFPGDRATVLAHHPEGERPIDVAFVGNMDGMAMPARVRFFRRLDERLSPRRTRYLGRGRPGEVYPRSKIVIQCSSRPAWCYDSDTTSRVPHAQGINTRVFEAMGFGAMLLADLPIPDIELAFARGRHFEGYHQGDVASAVDRIEYFLEHPEERMAIARNGWEEVATRHTTEARGSLFTSILSGRLHETRPPAPPASRRREALSRALLRMALHDGKLNDPTSSALYLDHLALARRLCAGLLEDRDHPLARTLLPYIDFLLSRSAPPLQAWWELWDQHACPVAALCLEVALRWSGQRDLANGVADWRQAHRASTAPNDRTEIRLIELLFIAFQSLPRDLPPDVRRRMGQVGRADLLPIPFFYPPPDFARLPNPYVPASRTGGRDVGV